MELNKKNMKNLILLIVFAVLFYVGVQRIENLAAGILFVCRVVFPFILGGALAFILNIPMSFLEEKLFHKVKKKKFVKFLGLSGMFHSLCGGCDSGCAGGCIAGGGNNFFQYQQEYRSLSSKTAEMGNRYVPLQQASNFLDSEY